MTVQTTTNVATGIGNDVTTVFPFNFKLTSETDLVVLDVTTADETYTELTLGSDYTVQGVGSENGGSITLAVPLPSGHEVKMARELDILQQTDLRNQGKFFAETHEDVFDRLVMILQQLQNGLDRSVKVPVTSNTPADQLFQEFKQDIADAESAAEASEAARDESQEIADKFGDVDGAVTATQALRDEAAASEAVATAKAFEAEDAADRAELAADTAVGNADVYADTTAGLAATVAGEQFQVLSADNTEFIRYRHDAGSVAAEVGRYPTAEFLRSSEDSIRISDLQPNLLTTEEFLSYTLPLSQPNTNLAFAAVNGARAIQASSTISGGEARAIWRATAASIQSGLVSAQVKLLSTTGVTSGSIRLIQRDANLGQISNAFLASLSTDVSTGRAFRVSGVPLDPSAFYVDIDITLINASGTVTFVAASPMIADGSVAYLRASSKTQIEELRESLSADAGVRQVYQDLPLSLQTLATSGGAVVSSQGYDAGKSFAQRINGTTSSSGIVAVRISDEPIKVGEVVRLSVELGLLVGTPAVGLGFGSASSAYGFALRSNAQLLTLAMPSGVTGGVSGPAARTYGAGERIQIDARVSGGSAGNYSIDYFVEYSDGERTGPYTVSGVTSIDCIWFMQRASSDWRNVRLTRHTAPKYLDEYMPEIPDIAPTVVYVSTTGSDTNSGSKVAPLATIGAAYAKLGVSGIVELAAGEYRDTVVLSNIKGDITLRSEPYKRAIILGSNNLSLTKTVGYSSVYQAPLATKPTGMGGSRGAPMIFEWGTPSKPIPVAERHDLHRGEQFRLPYTEMIEAASIAELDTVDGRGKWFWVSGNIYLSATDGGDATLKRYEVRARSTLVADGPGSLTLDRIDTYFSASSGVRSEGLRKLVRNECRAFGHYQDGFQDDANITYAVRDEAAGCGNDGINGHAISGYASTGNRDATYVGTYIDPWSHDNYDDGHSYHERGECSVFGGLLEHNNKAGCVQVMGASVTCYHTLARGQTNGFYAATPPSDDRANSVLRCHGTVSSDNAYNYRTADAESVLLAFDAVSENPGLFGYYAPTGEIIARNCKASGDSEKVKSGAVTVLNDAALV